MRNLLPRRWPLVFSKWLERLMRRLAPRDASPTVSTVEEARMTLEERVDVAGPSPLRRQGHHRRAGRDGVAS